MFDVEAAAAVGVEVVVCDEVDGYILGTIVDGGEFEADDGAVEKVRLDAEGLGGKFRRGRRRCR